MKFATIAAAFFAALLTVEAAILPHEHHARFLLEKDAIAAELAAWKQSEAGVYAKENGFYTEPDFGIQSEDAKNEQLVRFFMSKLTVEKAQAENPEAEFSTASPFSLMTEEEFMKFVSKSGKLGREGLLRGLPDDMIQEAEEAEAELAAAASVDWTTSSKCVSAVKDQGKCGSCWAFSAVGAIESAYCRKKGSLKLFSDQQVTDCDSKSSGCDGGWMDWGLSYVKSKGGICTQSSYPYKSGSTGKTGTCKDNSCTKTAMKIKIAKVSATDKGLRSAIKKTPVSVAVAAGNPQWKQYKSGVLSSCSSSQLDHAVLAVGYDGKSFKLKNQWGKSWGNKGYIRLKRISSSSAACSVINTHNVYPVIE